MKRFLFTFVIVFVVIFALLNFRLIFAELNYRLANKVIDDKSFLSALTNNEVEASSLSGDGVIINIPSINATAPIIFEESVKEGIILDRLQDGVVHYSDTPKPGEKGTAIVLGHSSAYPWYRGEYGSIFALLNKVEVGDKIFITKDGEILTYEIETSLIFNPFSDDPRLNELEETNGSSIVLVSCWPVGTAYKRIAVKANLI